MGWTRLKCRTRAHGGLEVSNGGYRHLRSTEDRGGVSVGLEKRDNEEEREGLACPLLPCPRPLVVADLPRGTARGQCDLHQGCVPSTC